MGVGHVQQEVSPSRPAPMQATASRSCTTGTPTGSSAACWWDAGEAACLAPSATAPFCTRAPAPQAARWQAVLQAACLPSCSARRCQSCVRQRWTWWTTCWPWQRRLATCPTAHASTTSTAGAAPEGGVGWVACMRSGLQHNVVARSQRWWPDRRAFCRHRTPSLSTASCQQRALMQGLQQQHRNAPCVQSASAAESDGAGCV